MERVESGMGGYACFVNVHSLTESTRRRAVRESLSHATYAFADGVPLRWLARLQGEPIAGRVAGPDFMAAFLARTHRERHGFIGGPATADGGSRSGQAIARAFSVDSVTYAPPRRAFEPEAARDDWHAFTVRCAGSVPRIVWVALGAPKQECWVHEVSRLAPTTMFFAVGAAFDVLAGSRTRAPAWMQARGFEWLFRLAQEPRRLARRYAVSNARFAVRVVTDQLRGRKT